MVISAWPDGVAGLLLARVTMTAPGGTLSVRAAKGPRELHDVVDEWLTGMARQDGGRGTWSIHGPRSP
jgi:hypothetical protein